MAGRRHLALVRPTRQEGVRAAATSALGELLASRPELGEAHDALLAWHAEAVSAYHEDIPPSAPLACGPGCAHCCHLKVIVTGLEALALAAALRERLSAEALAALEGRLRAADAVTRGLTTGERAAHKLPCPVLGDDRLCLGFERRPFGCRGANSYDREACASAFARPDEDLPLPFYGPDKRAAAAFIHASQEALAKNGMDPRPLELIAALRVALEVPDVARRYARGEPVFEGAVDREAAE